MIFVFSGAPQPRAQIAIWDPSSFSEWTYGFFPPRVSGTGSHKGGPTQCVRKGPGESEQANFRVLPHRTCADIAALVPGRFQPRRCLPHNNSPPFERDPECGVPPFPWDLGRPSGVGPAARNPYPDRQRFTQYGPRGQNGHICASVAREPLVRSRRFLDPDARTHRGCPWSIQSSPCPLMAASYGRRKFRIYYE